MLSRLKFWRGNRISKFLEDNEIRLNRKRIVWFIVVIVLSGAASFFLIQWVGPYLEEWKQYRYLGVFLSAFVVNATIIFPAPLMNFSIPFAASLAAQTNLLSVVVLYALGASLGEGIGYITGRWGKRILTKNGGLLYQKVEGWLKRNGNWTITILSFQPIIPFDIAGIVAGTLKYNFAKFLFFCFLGRIPKYLILIGGGYEIWKWLFG